MGLSLTSTQSSVYEELCRQDLEYAVMQAMVSFTEDLGDSDYTARQNTNTVCLLSTIQGNKGGTGRERTVGRKRRDANKMEEGVI